MSAENLSQRIARETGSSDTNHWLEVRFPARTNFEKAEARLAGLTDEQITETYNSLYSHLGRTESLSAQDAEILREGLEQGLSDLQEEIGGSSRFIQMDAPPGEWQDQAAEAEGLGWHAVLFALSVSGVLQSGGAEVEGTNIPRYPADMPDGYWPEAGAIGLWSPQL